MDKTKWIAAVLIAAGFTQAATVYFDDFQDDMIGGLSAIGAGNTGASNAFFGAVSIQVNPESNGNTSSQVLRGGDSTNDFNRIYGYFAAGAQSIDGMIFSYDFYSTGTTNANNGVRFGLMQTTGFNGVNGDGYVRIDPSGLIRLDAVNQSGVTGYGADVWQHFSGTYTQIGTTTNYNFVWTLSNLETAASITRTNTFGFAGVFTNGLAAGFTAEMVDTVDTTGDAYSYIDNLTVTVPGPVASHKLSLFLIK